MSTTTKGQIEIDWSKAPRGAEEAILEIHWADRNGDKFGWDVIAQHVRPPAVAHPHAEVMAKYAEVAARRVDPWVEFELYSEPFDDWVALETPTFFDTTQQNRYIGDDK